MSVTDIQSIDVVIDEEDRELLAMFPRHRECRLEEMLLVNDGGKAYLIRKADLARAGKIKIGIIRACVAATYVVLLIAAVSAFVSGRNASGWLALFDVSCLPVLAMIPKGWWH